MTYIGSLPMQMSGWKLSDFRNEMTMEIANEILSAMIGISLGSGISREVFAYEYNPTLVLKFEDMNKGHFANIAEYHTWNNVIGTPYEKWFAPVRGLSLGGHLLIQERTTPAFAHQYPASIPSIFSDVKMSNFGMMGDRFVCHDYSYLQNGFRNKQAIKMKKVSWV